MALFESREERALRRQMAIKTAQKKTQRYAEQCRNMAGKYHKMAKEAIRYGNETQCDRFLYRRLQYHRQAQKWGSFQLDMEELALQGEMAGAMGAVVDGMKALTKEIKVSISFKEMTRVVGDLKLAMGRLEQVEDKFSDIMSLVSPEFEAKPEEAGSAEIPETDRQEVSRMRDLLREEVLVMEKAPQGDGARDVSAQSGDIDDRIKSGRERLRKMRP